MMCTKPDARSVCILAIMFFVLCVGDACVGPASTPVTATVPPKTQVATMSGDRIVVVDQAPLRADPKIEAQQLSMLRRGQRVSLIGVSPDKAWYLVRTDVYTGTGWILAELVDLPAARVTVDRTGVILRAGPGSDYDRLEEIQKAVEYEVVGQTNACSWLEVVTPTGITGWVFGRDVTLNVRCSSVPAASVPPTREQSAGRATATLQPLTPSTQPTVTRVSSQLGTRLVARAVVNTSSLNVRSGPGTNYDLIGVTEKGHELEVIGQMSDCEWLRIQLPDGRTGWISSQYTTLNVQCNSIPGATPVATPTSGVILPAPVLVAPDDNATSDAVATVVLEWSSVKEPLGNNEYYIITIRFKHGGNIWTDYAFTLQTRWPVAEHAYLVDLSGDGRFEWSVQLIRATGKNADGVPQGNALSSPSAPRAFVLRRPQPNPEPTRSCGGYPCGLKEVPTPVQLLITAGWLSFGLLIGVTLITEHSALRKKRNHPQKPD